MEENREFLRHTMYSCQALTSKEVLKKKTVKDNAHIIEEVFIKVFKKLELYQRNLFDFTSLLTIESTKITISFVLEGFVKESKSGTIPANASRIAITIKAKKYLFTFEIKG